MTSDTDRSCILEESRPLHRPEQKLRAVADSCEIREPFVATLTHDLRNPLSSAKMSMQLATRCAGQPDRVIALCSRAIESLDRADRMIQDLLDVSRISSGAGLRLDFERCDLTRIARTVCEEMTGSYGAYFTVKATGSIIGYWCTRQLRRTLENLAVNAVKYGDITEPITMTLSQTSEEVKCEVHNFGNPISEEERPHLFDSFQRASTAKGKAKGWGLGLSVVKGVIEGHGGRISVSSSKSLGTTFTFVLPLDSRQATFD